MKQFLLILVAGCLFLQPICCAEAEVPAAEPLAAIDVLLEPDPSLLAQATADNARLRKDWPEGFALDEAHTPHITVIQCYVRAKDLDKVLAVVKQVTDARDPAGMELKTTGYFYIPWQGKELAGINVAQTPELLEYQRAIVAAVTPFTVKNGTADAFVPNEDGTPAGETTVSYVSSFIPEHIGPGYSPHLTIGVGRESFLKEMTAAPYTPLTFSIKGVGLYQLGDFGTARKKIWRSNT